MIPQFDAFRPERLSLGGQIQETAIKINNNKKFPVAGFVAARVYSIILKPPARIADVSLHIILGFGKTIVGLTVTMPLDVCVRLLRGHGIRTDWTVKQGVCHFGYATLYAVDIFVSPFLNAISPDIYPAKEQMRLREEVIAVEARKDREKADEIQLVRQQVSLAKDAEKDREVNRVRIDLEARLVAAEESLRQLQLSDAGVMERLNQQHREAIEQQEAARNQQQEEITRLTRERESLAAENDRYREVTLLLERVRDQQQKEINQLTSEKEILAAENDSFKDVKAEIEEEENNTRELLHDIAKQGRSIPPPPPPPALEVGPRNLNSADKTQTLQDLINTIENGDQQNRFPMLKKSTRREFLWKRDEHQTPGSSSVSKLLFHDWAQRMLVRVRNVGCVLQGIGEKIETYRREGLEKVSLEELREGILTLEEKQKKQIEENSKHVGSGFRDRRAVFGSTDDDESDDEWEEEESTSQAFSIDPMMMSFVASVGNSSDDKKSLFENIERLYGEKYQQYEASREYLMREIGPLPEPKASAPVADNPGQEEAEQQENLQQKLNSVQGIVFGAVWESLGVVGQRQLEAQGLSGSFAKVVDQRRNQNGKEPLDDFIGNLKKTDQELIDSLPAFERYVQIQCWRRLSVHQKRGLCEKLGVECQVFGENPPRDLDHGAFLNAYQEVYTGKSPFGTIDDQYKSLLEVLGLL